MNRRLTFRIELIDQTKYGDILIEAFEAIKPVYNRSELVKSLSESINYIEKYVKKMEKEEVNNK